MWFTHLWNLKASLTSITTMNAKGRTMNENSHEILIAKKKEGYVEIGRFG